MQMYQTLVISFNEWQCMAMHGTKFMHRILLLICINYLCLETRSVISGPYCAVHMICAWHAKVCKAHSLLFVCCCISDGLPARVACVQDPASSLLLSFGPSLSSILGGCLFLLWGCNCCTGLHTKDIYITHSYERQLSDTGSEELCCSGASTIALQVLLMTTSKSGPTGRRI